MSEPADAAPADPEAIDGVLPPRETERLLGQETAAAAFDAAWAGGRRHHAWLLRGPRGIGKASFAYGLARRVLAEGLDPAEAGRAERLIRAGAHPGLFELRRGYNERTKKPRAQIVIEDVRRLIGFFQLSAADRGWRIALIDPADALNTAAANALLKLLEEPPSRALFLLIAHSAGRLPATIRSRCRRLDFAPPAFPQAVEAIEQAAPDVATGEAAALCLLADNAPGEALRLRAAGGAALYEATLAFLEAPREPARQRPLLDAAAARDPGAAGFETLARLLPLAIARLARERYRDAQARRLIAEILPAEAAAAATLCPSDAAARLWAEAAPQTRDRLEAALGLNLDPGRAILDTALYLEEVSRRARGA